MKKLIIFTMLSCLSMGIFAKESKEDKFWTWFQKNEDKIFEFEKDQESIFDEISAKLNAYKSDVVFEFSMVKDGKREFVISADGLKDNLSAVEKLASAAPKMKRWEVIAFRPRMNDYAEMELVYAGKDLSPAKLWIYYRVKDGHFDLIIYHPEFTEEEKNLFVSGSYILLDTAIGEYDVVTGIRYIDHQRLPENPQEIGLIPFSELREVFDAYKSKNG